MTRTGTAIALLMMTMTGCATVRQKPLDVVFSADDTDSNGLVSEQEWHAAAQKRFELLDTNRDGNISREEMNQGKSTLKARFKEFRSGK